MELLPVEAWFLCIFAPLYMVALLITMIWEGTQDEGQ